MKTITKAKLLAVGCCSESVNRYFPNETKRRQVDDILKEVIRTKDYLDGALVLSMLMTQKQRVAWAIYSAEQVLHIFEDKHPDDNRPRKAIEAAKAWLKDPSADAANAAAYAAADAAADAAYAAYAAANAAHAAAYAAYADADAAAKDKMYKKLLIKGLQIVSLDAVNSGDECFSLVRRRRSSKGVNRQ